MPKRTEEEWKDPDKASLALLMQGILFKLPGVLSSSSMRDGFHYNSGFTFFAADREHSTSLSPGFHSGQPRRTNCLETEFQTKREIYALWAEEPLRRFYEYGQRLSDTVIQDDDDYYRLGRHLRKVGGPVSLHRTATDGLVEDFFNGWDFGSDPGDYRPLPANWGLIFPSF